MNTSKSLAITILTASYDHTAGQILNLPKLKVNPLPHYPTDVLTTSIVRKVPLKALKNIIVLKRNMDSLSAHSLANSCTHMIHVARILASPSQHLQNSLHIQPAPIIPTLKASQHTFAAHAHGEFDTLKRFLTPT